MNEQSQCSITHARPSVYPCPPLFRRRKSPGSFRGNPPTCLRTRRSWVPGWLRACEWCCLLSVWRPRPARSPWGWHFLCSEQRSGNWPRRLAGRGHGAAGRDRGWLNRWPGQGARQALRRGYWGWGAEAMPLDGRACYPEGEGPLPGGLIFLLSRLPLLHPGVWDLDLDQGPTFRPVPHLAPPAQ
jgi:hypothetical protein